MDNRVISVFCQHSVWLISVSWDCSFPSCESDKTHTPVTVIPMWTHVDSRNINRIKIFQGMSIVGRFDKYLFTFVIGEWLAMNEIACLNSSMTNKKERKIFDENVSCQLTLFHGIQGFRVTAKYLNWLASHKMCVNFLIVGESQSTDRAYDFTFLNLLFSKLKALHHFFGNLTEGTFMLHKFPQLTQIYLTDNSSVKDEHILSLVLASKQLTFIHFQNLTSITHITMDYLGTHCAVLQHLVIYSCKLIPYDDAFLENACFASQLVSFHRMADTNSSVMRIRVIDSYCPSLVAFSGKIFVDHMVYDADSWQATVNVLSKLTYFNGVLSDKMLTGWQTADNTIYPALQFSTNLTCIKLYLSYNITDVGMKIICTRCKLLTELDIACNLTGEAFCTIANELYFLRNIKFDLGGMNKHIKNVRALVILSERFQNIDCIFNNDSIGKMQGIPFTHQLPHKITINTHYTVFNKINSVTDLEIKVLQYILPKCANLSQLHWQSFKPSQITTTADDTGYSYDFHLQETPASCIARHCSKLNELFLTRLNDDQTAGLIALAQRNTLLTKISFLNDAINDAAFEAFCVHCPYLRSIKLNNCANLTDQSLLTIVQHCRKSLRQLDIFSCKQISNREYGQLIMQKCVLLHSTLDRFPSSNRRVGFTTRKKIFTDCKLMYFK